MRRLFAVLLLVCALVPTGPGRVAVADESEAQQAAREIADARERANAAADAYFAAESRLDSVEVETQLLEAEIAELRKKRAALHKRVQQIAVNRFTRSSSAGSPLLNGFASAEEQMQVAALTAVITDTSEEDFDVFDSLTLEVEEKKRELAATQQEAATATANAQLLRDQAMAEVENLKVVEAGRLKDEAVRKALVAEERARAADAARAAVFESETTDTSVAPGVSDDAGAFDIDDGGGPAPTTGAASGSVSGSGGQTGAGGTGGRPGGGVGEDYGGVDWVCPTGDVAVGFGDTWGAPRSGGRRHQGVDMIGTRGTPILAVVDGFAKEAGSVMGGINIGFDGVDGIHYYYGHLDSIAKLGAVHAGDVIGFLGDTGNAIFSTPHLHFEIHPSGAGAVNPYTTVRAHC
ncbi:MAG: M23 family metallopeptidase [Actinobacteria bacterium]|nr:M23 family metallopeptidase [Actinomycetota bacterium]